MNEALYRVTAMILDRNPDASAELLSEVLKCAKSTAYNLRSFYIISGRDPERMREKANESSRINKRKARISENMGAMH